MIEFSFNEMKPNLKVSEGRKFKVEKSKMVNDHYSVH